MNQPFRRSPDWVFLLLILIVIASGCTAVPPPSATRGDVTALQLAVERHRQESFVSVQIDQYIPIQENDRIAVDTSGRALLRFSDRLLVELFRGTEIEIAEVRQEPADLVFMRLRQVVGHVGVDLKSDADMRLVLSTDYATIRPMASGTTFAVCQAPGVTCTVTIKGETEVQAQGQVVAVRGGEGTFIRENEPPLPPVCVDLSIIRRWQDQLRSLEEVPPLVDLVSASQGIPCPGAPSGTAIAEATAPPSTTPATPEPFRSAGGADLWVNPVDQAVYGRVPAGEFIMGLDEGYDNEKPAHSVYLDEFWLMHAEVTNAQYAYCVEAGACTPPGNERWSVPAFADHPVTHVTWSQANAYALWAGGRLPTEAEWEKAARGPDGRIYPWGDEPPDKQRANFNHILGVTMPVSSYLTGASPYGMLDMAGNAEEWVADWYDHNYYAQSPERNPPGPPTGALRVLRGGSFRHNRQDVRAPVRAHVVPESKLETIGFRVAVSAPPNETFFDPTGALADAQSQTQLALEYLGFLQAALAAEDRTAVRRHAEQLVNILEGERGVLFGDNDRDGEAQNPGDGVGVRTHVTEAWRQAQAVLVALEGATVDDTNHTQAQEFAIALTHSQELVQAATNKAFQLFSVDTARETQLIGADLESLLHELQATIANAITIGLQLLQV